jgi:hypothetical protein
LPSWPTWWALGSWCFSARTVLKSRSVNCKQYQVKCLCCILCNSTFTSVLLEQTPNQQQRSLTFPCDSSLFLGSYFVFVQAVVHVSTAYSHCYRSDINEEFYDPPMTCDQVVKLIECLDENTMTAITPTWVAQRMMLDFDVCWNVHPNIRIFRCKTNQKHNI